MIRPSVALMAMEVSITTSSPSARPAGSQVIERRVPSRARGAKSAASSARQRPANGWPAKTSAGPFASRILVSEV